MLSVYEDVPLSTYMHKEKEKKAGEMRWNLQSLSLLFWNQVECMFYTKE